MFEICSPIAAVPPSPLNIGMEPFQICKCLWPGSFGGDWSTFPFSLFSNKSFTLLYADHTQFMKSIFITHVRPIIDFYSSLLHFIFDSKALESVQQYWTRQIEGISNLLYSERLRRLSIFPNWSCSHITHNPSHLLLDLLVLSLTHRTRGHPFQLIIFHSTTDACRRFFIYRIVTAWNNLSSEIVPSPTLNIFKFHLQNYLSDFLYYYD